MSKLIRSPNRWSCLPASFAMACNVSIKEFLDAVGHDGSEIKWPDLPEPKKRRGFHIEECTRAAYSLGYHFLMFQTNPMAMATNDKYYTVNHSDFVNHLMENHTGVLLGDGVKTKHAVYWGKNVILDPNGMTYNFHSNWFSPKVFLPLI